MEIRINEIIREERLSHGESQEELARIVGRTGRTISAWESGYYKPQITDLKKLSEHWNVSIDYLRGVDEQREIKAEQNSKIENELAIEHLLKRLLEEGIIEDPNNIDKDTLDMIIHAVQTDLLFLKKKL